MTRETAITTGARQPRSDALVFFGATGDLAYKEIFTALHAMVKRRRLERVVGLGPCAGFVRKRGHRGG